MTTNDLTQAKNDVYGNPRVIVHFSSLLTDKENNELSIDAAYNLAHKRALKLGGKIYRGKDFGTLYRDWETIKNSIAFV